MSERRNGSAPAARERRSQAQPVSLLDQSPPADLEAEAALVGSILLWQQAIDDVSAVVRRSDFHDEAHGDIWSAAIELHEAGKAVDPRTIVDQLRKHGAYERVGGAAALARLMQSVPNGHHAAYYASIVRERSLRRQLLIAAEEALRDAHADSLDCDAILERHEARVMALGERSLQRPLLSAREVCQLTLDALEQRMTGQQAAGVQTGFRGLDGVTGGMRGGQLWVLAARPGMGKTAFALNLAENVGIGLGEPCLVCSLEMSAAELGDRLLASMSGVSAHRMREGSLSRDDRHAIIEASAAASQGHLVIYDESTQSVRQIAAMARRQKRKHGLSLLIVDYLQLIEPESVTKGENREQQVARMTRRLKQLARELSCPILVLAQLNRQAEDGRENNRPRLKHLRESGAIEQDADVVMFVHREEYYRPTDDTVRGQADLIVAKQRNGPTGDVQLNYRRECMRFEDRVPPRVEAFDNYNDPQLEMF